MRLQPGCRVVSDCFSGIGEVSVRIWWGFGEASRVWQARSRRGSHEAIRSAVPPAGKHRRCRRRRCHCRRCRQVERCRRRRCRLRRLCHHLCHRCRQGRRRLFLRRCHCRRRRRCLCRRHCHHRCRCRSSRPGWPAVSQACKHFLLALFINLTRWNFKKGSDTA